MATDLFTNLAGTTVTTGGTTAPVAGTVETWTVASSATFPAAAAGVSQFRVQEDDVTRQSEIMLVTNVSGVTWTVTRGVEGTTPVAHPGSFAVVSTITAGILAVLGTPATAMGPTGTGLVGKGYRVPAGSLEVWRAARNASATTRCEVVGFGDSLMFGQGPTVGYYSFLQRLRERAGTDGYTDGGRGYNAHGNATPVDNFTGETTPVAAQTGFNAGTPGAIFSMPASSFSTTLNESITYTVFGTACRIWWSRYFQAGRFSYKVNAQAAVVVNASYNESAPLPTLTGGLSSIDTILLGAADGLVSGTNTVVITNLGGAPIGPPGGWNSVSVGGTGGTVPAGTYDFVATGTNGTGETSQTATIVTTTVTAGQQVTLSLDARNLNALGITNIRFYARTPSGSGLYSFVGTVPIGASNAFTTYVWTGTPAIDTATHPPAAPGTAGLDASNKLVAVNVEWLKAAGIVWQNQGTPGTSTADVFDPNNQNNDVALASLGLQWGTGSNGSNVGVQSEQLPTAAQSGFDTPINRTQARKPSLVIVAFGTNDIQRSEGGALGTPPTSAAAGVGVGSGLAAGTYFYKVQRIAATSLRGGSLSPVSTSVTVTAGQQVLVTAPQLGSNSYVNGAAFNVYRSTTSGGTYGLVGQIVGSSQQMLDNTATTGPAPINITTITPVVDTSSTENSLALALRLIRNSGADALVVLPSVESLTNSRTLGGVFKAAIQKVADTFSVPWVDFDVALGPTALRSGLGYGGGNSNPHLLKPAYQTQGDFIWDKVLKL